MARTPRTVPELIDAFGGATKFAEAIGLKGPSTASEMKRSGRISSDYWVRVVSEAKAHDISGVTYEMLARLHATDQQARAS